MNQGNNYEANQEEYHARETLVDGFMAQSEKNANDIITLAEILGSLLEYSTFNFPDLLESQKQLLLRRKEDYLEEEFEQLSLETDNFLKSSRVINNLLNYFKEDIFSPTSYISTLQQRPGATFHTLKLSDNDPNSMDILVSSLFIKFPTDPATNSGYPAQVSLCADTYIRYPEHPNLLIIKSYPTEYQITRLTGNGTHPEIVVVRGRNRFGNVDLKWKVYKGLSSLVDEEILERFLITSNDLSDSINSIPEPESAIPTAKKGKYEFSPLGQSLLINLKSLSEDSQENSRTVEEFIKELSDFTNTYLRGRDNTGSFLNVLINRLETGNFSDENEETLTKRMKNDIETILDLLINLNHKESFEIYACGYETKAGHITGCLRILWGNKLRDIKDRKDKSVGISIIYSPSTIHANKITKVQFSIAFINEERTSFKSGNQSFRTSLDTNNIYQDYSFAEECYQHESEYRSVEDLKPILPHVLVTLLSHIHNMHILLITEYPEKNNTVIKNTLNNGFKSRT